MELAEFIETLSNPRAIQTARGPVSYLDVGEGPVVLALHGAMGGFDQSAILARLAVGDGYRIIAPSRPGFPGTPRTAPSGPQAQAERMLALLDALKIETCAVIAISGGGPCAIHIALRASLRCSALVLVSTVSGANPVEIPRRFAAFKMIARIPGLPRLLKKAALRGSEARLVRSFPDPQVRERVVRDPETWALYQTLNAGMFNQLPQRLTGSEDDFVVTASTDFPLEDVRVPTLIVHGTEDPYVPYERHAVSARDRICDVRLLTLRGGGHAALFSHRAEVRDAVRAFLATPGAAPA